MFDSLHPILLTPNSLHAVPTSFDADQLRTLRIEASARSLDYLRRTPPEEYGVHPLGFLNILLFESRSCRIRIHVWHDRLFMPTSPYKIHDHSYSSYSVILAGRLRNSIYHEDSNSSGDRSDYFVANATPGSTNTNLQFTDETVSLVPSAEMDLWPGSAYGLWRNVFHYAQPASSFAMTLYFHLRHPDSTGISRVTVPSASKDLSPTVLFPYRQLSREDVRSLESTIATALDLGG